MQIGGKSIRVKLIIDLTKYHSECIIGMLGWSIPDYKVSYFGSQDRFVAVKFDNGIILDVLWKSLEILS